MTPKHNKNNNSMHNTAAPMILPADSIDISNNLRRNNNNMVNTQPNSFDKRKMSL